jgi:hypothetical protein
MQGKRTRKTEPSRAGRIRVRDIPAWVKEIPDPPMADLEVLFTRMRTDFTPFSGIQDEGPAALVSGPPDSSPSPNRFADYFDRVVAKAEELSQGPGAFEPLIELLDMVPGVLLCLQRYPWVRERLMLLFRVRAYAAFGTYAKTLGRQESEQNYVINALYRFIRQQQGGGHKQAVRIVRRHYPQLSTDRAVELAIKRANESPVMLPGGEDEPPPE